MRRRSYWQRVQPGVLIAEDVNPAYLVNQLMGAGRHRTAFQAIHMQFKKADAARVVALLEAMSAGADTDGPLPDGWHVGEAMKAVEESGVASRRQLALLQFVLRHAGPHEHGTKPIPRCSTIRRCSWNVSALLVRRIARPALTSRPTKRCRSAPLKAGMSCITGAASLASSRAGRSTAPSSMPGSVECASSRPNRIAATPPTLQSANGSRAVPRIRTAHGHAYQCEICSSDRTRDDSQRLPRRRHQQPRRP